MEVMETESNGKAQPFKHGQINGLKLLTSIENKLPRYLAMLTIVIFILITMH